MASFKHTIITKKGHALMAKAVVSKQPIQFVNIKTSNHVFENSTNLETVETLESIKQVIGISEVKVQNDTTVEVSGVLSNKDLAEGYYCSAVALYAKDGDTDIIYSITTADQADWVPADNGTSATSVLFKLVTAVSNAANVSLNVDPLMFATVAQINELRTRLDKIDDADTPIEHVQTLTSVQSLPTGSLDGAVSGLEIEGLSLVNMVRNGDFSEGAKNWLAAENGASSFNVSSGEVTIVGKDYEWVQMVGTDNNIITINTGDKIFLYAQMMSDNNRVSEHRLYIDGVKSGEGDGIIKKNSVANQYNDVYGFTVKSGDHEGGTRFIAQFRYLNGGALNSINKIKNYKAINMTALGIENYTEDQMLALVRSGYIDGLKGVSKPSVKVTGKNLFDIERHFTKEFLNWSKGNLLCTQRVKKGVSYRIQTFYKKIGVVGQGGVAIIFGDTIPPKKSNWFVSTSYGNRICAYEHNEQYIDTVYTPDTDGYISIYAGTLDIKATISLENTMLIEESKYSGNYEPYQSSTLTTDVELRSLPNGVKDRIYMQDGQLMLEKRVGEHIFKKEDFKRLFTGLNNNDLLETVDNVFKDSCVFNTEKNGFVLIEGVNQVRQADRELSISIGSFHTTTPLNGIDFIFNKGKYTDLESAIDDYIEKKAFYLLATPEIINLTERGLVNGVLESIKNGTCIVDSDTFIPPRVSFGVPTDLGAQVSSLLSGQNALSKAVATKADRVQEGWIKPTLINGAQNYKDNNVYYEYLKFYKDEFEVVTLRGVIATPAEGVVICILPEGYRPISPVFNTGVTNNSNHCRIDVSLNGMVKIYNSTGVWIAINIQFRAEA